MILANCNLILAAADQIRVCERETTCRAYAAIWVPATILGLAWANHLKRGGGAAAVQVPRRHDERGRRMNVSG